MTERIKYGSEQILRNQLEPLPFNYLEPKTLIYFTCPEGTNLCPRSGFPDFWTAHIWYVPMNQIVELKSLKLYLNGFREKSVYHEELGHLIFKDLKDILAPQYLKIVLDFTRRGNIQTDVALEFRISDYRGPEAPPWKIRYEFR